MKKNVKHILSFSFVILTFLVLQSHTSQAMDQPYYYGNQIFQPHSQGGIPSQGSQTPGGNNYYPVNLSAQMNQPSLAYDYPQGYPPSSTPVQHNQPSLAYDYPQGYPPSSAPVQHNQPSVVYNHLPGYPPSSTPVQYNQVNYLPNSYSESNQPQQYYNQWNQSKNQYYSGSTTHHNDQLQRVTNELQQLALELNNLDEEEALFNLEGAIDEEISQGNIFILKNTVLEQMMLNNKVTFDLLQRFSKIGNGRALYVLGIYHESNNRYQNETIAKDCFLRAAEQGCPAAQFKLGIFYAATGINQNKSEAIKWLEKAAQQGHPAAQFRLGWHYLVGDGVYLDKRTGIYWQNLAAAQDYVKAGFTLKSQYILALNAEKEVFLTDFLGSFIWEVFPIYQTLMSYDIYYSALYECGRILNTYYIKRKKKTTTPEIWLEDIGNDYNREKLQAHLEKLADEEKKADKKKLNSITPGFSNGRKVAPTVEHSCNHYLKGEIIYNLREDLSNLFAKYKSVSGSEHIKHLDFMRLKAR